MTAPVKPTPPSGADVVVEIDAMDVSEWEHGQRTPQASDENLAALVEKTARPAAPPAPPAAPSAPPGDAARNTVVRPRPPGARAATSSEPAALAAPAVAAPRPVPSVPSVPPSLARRTTPRASSNVPVPPGAPRPLATAPVVPSIGFDEPPAPHEVTSAETPASRQARSPSPTANPPPSRPVSPPSVAVPARVTPITMARGAPPAGALARPGSAESLPSAVPLPLPAPVDSARVVAPRLDDRARAPQPARHPGPDRVTDAPISPDPAPAAAEPGRRRLVWLAGAAAGVAAIVAVILVSTSGSRTVEAPAGGTAPAGPVAARGEDPGEPVAGRDVASPGSAARGAAPAAAAPSDPDDGATATATASGSTPRQDAASVAVAPPVAHAAAEPASEPDEPAARPRVLERAPGTAPAVRDDGRRVAMIRPTRRPAKRLGIKPIVVEYSEPSDGKLPGLVAQAEEDPAIAKARTAYLAGNQKLFAGDTQGAIAAYKRSLELYPGYVGGYRGLGLAHAQRGDEPKALDAFKMYLSMAPTARDAALIKKRISRLQGKQ